MEFTTQDLRRASFSRRVIAFLIDQFLFVVLSSLTAGLMSGFSFITNNSVPAVFEMLQKFSLQTGVLWGGLFLFKDLYRGVSPGRYVMGIAVRQNHNFDQPVIWWRLILRNCFYLIYFIEAMVMLIHPKSRRLGDMVFDTTVIRVGYARPLAFIGMIGLLLISSAFLDAQKNYWIDVNLKESAKNMLHFQEEIEQKIGKIQKIEEVHKDAFKINKDDKNLNIDLNVTGESGQMQVRVGFMKDENGEWILQKVMIQDRE